MSVRARDHHLPSHILSEEQWAKARSAQCVMFNTQTMKTFIPTYSCTQCCFFYFKCICESNNEKWHEQVFKTITCHTGGGGLFLD